MYVIYYQNKNKSIPVKQFIDSLPNKQQVKILRILLYVQKYGLSSIIPHVKKIIGTDLWEIRILGRNNIRIIYVIPLSNTVLLLHGFIKKTNKTPKNEINIALKRLKEWKMLIDK